MINIYSYIQIISFTCCNCTHSCMHFQCIVQEGMKNNIHPCSHPHGLFIEVAIGQLCTYIYLVIFHVLWFITCEQTQQQVCGPRNSNDKITTYVETLTWKAAAKQNMKLNYWLLHIPMLKLLLLTDLRLLIWIHLTDKPNNKWGV